jgi:hypothetical protein
MAGCLGLGQLREAHHFAALGFSATEAREPEEPDDKSFCAKWGKSWDVCLG